MRKLLFIVGILITGLALTAYFMYNKPHKNMDKASVDEQVNATELFADFATDENAANGKYLDQVLAVTGKVREVSTNEEGTITIILDTDSPMAGVVCELDELSKHAKTNFETGETISVKGVCTGMLMDVILVRCVIISGEI